MLTQGCGGVQLDLSLQVPRPMSATDVSPGSHIHTPEWQSFESRMRARAAHRRQARRRRRVRFVGLTLVACLGVAAGWLTTASLPGLSRQAEVLAARWLESEPPVPARAIMPRPPAAEPLPIPSSVSMPAEEPASVEPDATAESAPVSPPAGEEARRSEPPQPASAERPPTVIARNETPQPPVGTSLRERSAPTRQDAPAARSPATAREPVNSQPAPLVTALRAPAPAEVAASPPPAPVESLASPPVEPTPTPSTPVESAPASASTPAAVDLSRVRAAVRGAIEQYRSAYERLDASAAQSVWPGVDAAALARAFGSLESQRLSFDDCAIELDGTTADATCSGRASVVPKVGGGSQTVRRTWQFRLAQNGEEWKIARATVR